MLYVSVGSIYHSLNNKKTSLSAVCMCFTCFLCELNMQHVFVAKAFDQKSPVVVPGKVLSAAFNSETL